MRLYLDDDSASKLLAGLLRKAAHDVQTPADVGTANLLSIPQPNWQRLDRRLRRNPCGTPPIKTCQCTTIWIPFSGALGCVSNPEKRLVAVIVTLEPVWP